MQTQRAVVSLRLRAIAALLLALLFGLQAAPLAQAQAAETPDCCMAAQGKGCSMHLHRAARSQSSGHIFAALSPRCPCAAVAPVPVATYDSLAPAGSRLFFMPADGSAVFAPTRRVGDLRTLGSGGTRGPPAVALTA